MESREGIHSGVTVIGAEAPSNYHMAPRAENLGQVSGSSSVSGTPLTMGVSGTTEKKKRGRPRKYGPDGKVPMALSPTPISSLTPPTGDFSGGCKRGRGRSGGYLSKLQKKMGMEDLGDFGGISGGTNFLPHVINVSAGEDVTMKVISFSQQGPRSICILSANGAISNVTLCQADSSGGTLTYEGRFEILSLSGSFMPTESQGSRSRSGGMSVSLSSPDGRVIGGSVAGLLVAASPVQVVVGSFLPSNHLDEKPKKIKLNSTRAVGGPEANDEKEDDVGGHGLPNSDISRPNLDSSPSFGGENWAALHSLQDSRKMTTDINVSVPGTDNERNGFRHFAD